jgi:hypothetical protein
MGTGEGEEGGVHGLDDSDDDGLLCLSLRRCMCVGMAMGLELTGAWLHRCVFWF